MSYHVTILRTEGNAQLPITHQETEAAVAAVFPGSEIVEGRMKGTSEISLRSETGGDIGVFLIWQNNEIWTENPSLETIEALLKLAGELQARVRGDELETYRTSEETYIHSDDKEVFERTRLASRNLRKPTAIKNWLLYGGIMTLFLILALIVNHLSS